MQGRIHSLESFGTVDGPGVRYVVFFQGCPMRCQYCHNPDTWNPNGGTLMSAEEIIEKFTRNRAFYKSGGITATGGEPMLQIDFLTELFTLAKENDIHTCLDTSGIVFSPGNKDLMPKIDALLRVTDLVMLDIKHMDEDSHQKLTSQSGKGIRAFADYLEEKQIPMWLRHVIVPGFTYDEAELTSFANFVKSKHNVEKYELLPYHTMGVVKYENLGLSYPLKDVCALSKEELQKAQTLVDSIVNS
ncbi:MAG: pyruvate formate lyase-activating protein [Lachnospiraceae bacterium]|nr:pyruvate formate lyase-activating protein [Lachnospiraceae bacterium]